MKIGRKLAVPAFGLMLAGGGFAFLASNNVATSYAGQGSGTIAGYNVSNIHYAAQSGTLSGLSADNNSTFIQSVSFTLDHAATPANVRAVINAPGHNYTYDVCTAAGSADKTFTCTQSGNNNNNAANAAPIDTDSDSLTVIAAS